MDAMDSQAYESIPHNEHLTFVDKIKAGFQEPGTQRDYLVNVAAKRKEEYDQAQKSKQATGY